ncbi:MAG: alpha amylase C-terminal domain-containing protein, partial [Deltaproteobacteria bacterium]|nr:alpha amylase C-terminal domain-containing protein [Deltaproteobacteria bacterium]
VVNMANRGYDSYTIGFPREGLWKVRFNSDWHGYSPDFGNHPSYHTYAHAGSKDSTACNGNVGIGPYSVIVLSQDE